MKKTWKYLTPVIIFIILALTVFTVNARKYKSFEGRITGLAAERHHVGHQASYLPLEAVVHNQLKRIRVRTKRGKVLELAVYKGNLDGESVGKYIRGSYRPGRVIRINEGSPIFDFIDFPGPEIELKGNPDGVARRYKVYQ